MANLFGKNKLKSTAQTINTNDVLGFIDIVKKWHHDYHQGTLKQDKETSREQEYNQNFFKDILGYKEKPATPFNFEPKATTEKGQLPDAVIGYTDKTNDIKNMSAVVELKGAAIDLDRPQQREGNMSPVQQAFKYKTQYRNCPFVIVSNFWEFRLYHDNLLDYEAWTLDDLVNPDNDYQLFKTWYVLLKSDNFITPKGTSKTENILSDIRIEQENISKKFYKVYKEARLVLLRDIYSRNEIVRENIDIGVEKAQKIIDRVVFTCFAEDRGLLPDNTLQRVIRDAEQSSFGVSLWQAFKGLFEAIDSGSDKLEIPDGYNGGLFKHDEILDNLRISDDGLRPVVGLSKYDFSEDLSVSILGHIFEQSISDLEEIKNKVNVDKNAEAIITQSRRKKDGIFYTPDYIVRYIVDNSLGTYLREHEEAFKEEYKLHGDINDKTYGKREKQAYGKYQDFLQNIKVVDPACGSGAFLVYVFDYLMSENQRVGDILGNNIFSTDGYIRDILKNNIYGVDLNEESVEITKLSLWLKSAQKGKKLTSLDNNIKCGNSLIDDPAVAGNKAFNWQNQFSDVFKNGGFDIVIGNPPYVRQELIKDQVPYLSKNYVSYAGKADLYVYFFELATRLVKNSGLFGFISSGKFIEANYGKPLLAFLTSNTRFERIINFGDLEVFDGVTAYPLIVISRKNIVGNVFSYTQINDLDFGSLDSAVERDGLDYRVSDFIDNNYNFYSPNTARVLLKLKENSIKFTDVYPSPTVGIKTGYNEGYLAKDGLGYTFGRNIKRYHSKSKFKIIFPYEWTDEGYVLLPEEAITGINQLEVNKSTLSKRAIIREGLKNGTKVWYEYQQINKQLNFSEEYIIYPNVSLGTNFTLSKGSVIDMTGFIIPCNDRPLLAILNSKLFGFFMKHTAISRRGGYNEYKSQYITQFPVKILTDGDRRQLHNFVDLLLDATKDLYDRSEKFLKLVAMEFAIEKPSAKQKKWFTLDFEDFVTTLNVKLSLQQKDELLQLFGKYRIECCKIDEEIQHNSYKVDQLVYKLYNLTLEEISFVEQS